MKAPAFWGKDYKGGLLPALLSPLSCLYALAGSLRHKAATAYRGNVPVICIGNLVAGGTGKTPVALSLGKYLKSQGVDVHYLSRGYGGKLDGPVKVAPTLHSASDVGDEPLLLSSIATAWVSKDRVAGAKAAAEAGAELILLDDGYQNPHIYKDRSFVVIDAAVGFGNEAVMPAGPLRETITKGMARADAVILIGDGEMPTCLKAYENVPIHRAWLKPTEIESYTKDRYIAFAGIGRPEKFFETLRSANINLAACHAFGDHHPYSTAEIERLQAEAREKSAKLLTTEKDLARLPPELRKGIAAFPVILYWEDDQSPMKLLLKALPDG